MSDFIWVEKYRPKTIDDCILPENIKGTLKSFIEKGEVPNLLLSGPPGIGKTTVAKALCNEMGVDVYVINGSDEGRFLDTVRNHAKNFASTVSLQGNGKKELWIENKGKVCCEISRILFEKLETYGISTHYLSMPTHKAMCCKKVDIIPIEVVVRNVATGSIVRQTTLEEGRIFNWPLVEYYLLCFVLLVYISYQIYLWLVMVQR